MARDANRMSVRTSRSLARLATAMVAVVPLTGCLSGLAGQDAFSQAYFLQVFTSINNQWAAAVTRIPATLSACTNSYRGQTVQDLMSTLRSDVDDYREAFNTVMADGHLHSAPGTGPRSTDEFRIDESGNRVYFSQTSEIEDLTYYDTDATATLDEIVQLAENCPEANARKPMTAAQWRDTFWDISSP